MLVLLGLRACFVSIPELTSSAGPPSAGGNPDADPDAGSEDAAPATPPEAGTPTAPVERCSADLVLPERTVSFPADSGIVDVTRAPYSATGDGVTDDTAALQAAILDQVGTGRILYFPEGTYRLTDSLRGLDAEGAERSPVTLQGAGTSRTVLVLAPNTPGFDDAAAPQAVIEMGVTNYQMQGGGPARRNHVLDLSIRVESGNPGAIGLDFVGHDRSGVQNVAIESVDGRGAIGLRLERIWAGSRLIRNVSVRGFEVGIALSREQFSNTLEHIELSGQLVVGIRNQRSFTTIRRLISDNAVPAIENTHALGMIVLVEAELLNGNADATAINSEGELYLRDVHATGYGTVTRLRGLTIASEDVGEFSSREAVHLGRQGEGALGLPIREAPRPAHDDGATWVNAATFGALPDDELDDTEALQAALSSGAEVLYLPYGQYIVNGPLMLPASLRRFSGMESTIVLSDTAGAFGADTVSPLFRISEPAAEPLYVERLEFAAEGEDLNASLFEHGAARTVVLEMLSGEQRQWPFFYRGAAGAGDVFIENVHAGAVAIAEGQNAWLRAVNFELEHPMLENAGGTLWAIGVKSWSAATLLSARGGQSEILGAFLLPEPEVETYPPAFRVVNGEASLVFATITLDGEPDYPVHVEETVDEVMRILPPAAERVLGSGSYVPLFVGHDRLVRVCNTPAD